jgi:hypothetical protein
MEDVHACAWLYGEWRVQSHHIEVVLGDRRKYVWLGLLFLPVRFGEGLRSTQVLHGIGQQLPSMQAVADHELLLQSFRLGVRVLLRSSNRRLHGLQWVCHGRRVLCKASGNEWLWRVLRWHQFWRILRDLPRWSRVSKDWFCVLWCTYSQLHGMFSRYFSRRVL